MTTPMTARDVASGFGAAATWVPCDRAMPPAGELVEVLYADGVVCRAERVGNIFVTGSMYRYVNPAFWRPIDA